MTAGCTRPGPVWRGANIRDTGRLQFSGKFIISETGRFAKMLVLEADGRAADGAFGPLGRVVLAGLHNRVTQSHSFIVTQLLSYIVSHLQS